MFKRMKEIVSRKKNGLGSESISLRLEIARSRDDLESGFRLLFENRESEDLSVHDFKGMRVSPYHLLPTTTMIVARKINRTEGARGEQTGELVGTLTLIKSGPLGLPGVNDGEAKKYGHCGELSELAIAKSHSSHHHFIRQQLQNFALVYALDFMELEHVLVSGKTLQVFSPPAMVLARNALDTSIDPIWPQRKFRKCLDPVMDQQLLKHFFAHRSLIFKKFSDQQRLRTLLLFRGGDLFEVVRQILDMDMAPEFSIARGSMRFETRLICKVIGSDGKMNSSKIVGVSRKGLAIVLPSEVDQNIFRTITVVQVQLKDDLWSHLKVKPVSFQNFRGHEKGFEIIDADKNWLDYVFYLQADYLADHTELVA